jgi:hypothetical protein
MSSPAFDANARTWTSRFQTARAIRAIGRGWKSESENDAARVSSETAEGPEDPAALVARVDFPIKIPEVRQPFDGKAVLVLLTFDVSFHEMFRQPIADAPCLGTVCEGAVDGQCAIN